jgi:hypothetical protein
VIVFLILGAILNVAVAWGCMISQPSVMAVVYRSDFIARDLIDKLSDQHASDPDELLRGPTGLHGGAVVGTECSHSEGSLLVERLASCRVGFPRLCLEGAAIEGVRLDERGIDGPIEGYAWAVPSPRHGGDVYFWFLPTRPLWPGFVVDTLFYAVILWLLIPGPFVLRRVIRIKRGRCPKCGYDLRGQPPEVGAAPGRGCPECGWKREGAS